MLLSSLWSSEPSLLAPEVTIRACTGTTDALWGVKVGTMVLRRLQRDRENFPPAWWSLLPSRTSQPATMAVLRS